MKVFQAYDVLNTVQKNLLGENAVLATEDLSNIVDVGTNLFNNASVDNYVKAMVDTIGRKVFVDRLYKGGAPSVMMDNWEFGAAMEKISMRDIPEAQENKSWELEDGTVYSNETFYKPSVEVKFFSKKITFEIPCSITERQVKGSLNSADELNKFISMIQNNMENGMTLKLDGLIKRTINNFIGLTVKADYATAEEYTTKSGTKAINLLYLYNNGPHKGQTALTVEQAKNDPDFIRYAVYVMGTMKDRLTEMSTLYNIGARPRFTPKEDLHAVYLADFLNSAKVYLYNGNGQFKDEYIKISDGDAVASWQGLGKADDFNKSFEAASKINIKTSDGDNVELDGILGIQFDRYALGVNNYDRRTTTAYNAKAEFYNYFYKADVAYFNDTNENFIVYFIK